MRNVPPYIAERLKKNIQTRANDADPAARIWISRPSTVLVDDRFLERQTVLQSNITDVSIAVCHPRVRRSDSEIFVAYISNGVAKVASAKHKLHIDQHAWFDCGFEENATDVVIAFDGTMPKSYGSEVEFVTENEPWVFWINGGALYAKKLYSDEPALVLAESNCTDVSAIRAMWSNSNGDDYGFIVFFVLDGTIHYRQFINGKWMDAEVVSFGPSGITWSEITAFRTWDYRVGLQCKATTGKVYELFTQFMGIAKYGTDHINVDIDVKSKFHGIEYFNRKTKDEHVEIDSIAMRSALILATMPVITSAYNVEDSAGDWGTTIEVKFGNSLNTSTVQGNHLQFVLKDSWDVIYYPTSIDVGDDTTVVLTFPNLNQANGQCTLSYTPGTIKSIVDDIVEATSISFTPTNLKPIDAPRPEVESIWNE